MESEDAPFLLKVSLTECGTSAQTLFGDVYFVVANRGFCLHLHAYVI